MTTKNNNWQQEMDAEGIVWLSVDQVGASANTLNHELLEELDEILGELEAQRPTGLVIQSAKKDFIVGADIKEFTPGRGQSSRKPALSDGGADPWLLPRWRP